MRSSVLYEKSWCRGGQLRAFAIRPLERLPRRPLRRVPRRTFPRGIRRARRRVLHPGQRFCPLLEGESRLCLYRHHQLHVRLEQLTDELRVALFAAVRESKLDGQVLALDIAVLS